MSTCWSRLCTAWVWSLLIAGAQAYSAEVARSSAVLPDWGGGWRVQLAGAPPWLQFAVTPPPLKPEYLSVFQAAYDRVREVGGYDTCRPPQVVGYQNGLGFWDVLEFLFVPGRVVLLNDSGLIRHIHTGPQQPEPLDASNTGTSIGRWEGSTLVVETTRIDPAARFPLRFPGAPRIGRHAKLIERIRLVDDNTLLIESEMTAPDLFVRPFVIATRYGRVRPFVPVETQICVDDDPRVEPGTLHSRFDMTPPEDLPPPPAE